MSSSVFNGATRGIATLTRAGHADVRLSIGRAARSGTQRVTVVDLGTADVARGTATSAVLVTR